MASITLDPIGRIHSPRIEAKDDFWGNVISIIELDGARFTPDSVLELADFSHILVIYHRLPSPWQPGLAARRHFRSAKKRTAEQTWRLHL